MTWAWLRPANKVGLGLLIILSIVTGETLLAAVLAIVYLLMFER